MLLILKRFCQHLVIKRHLWVCKVCHIPCDSFDCRVFCTFKRLLCFEDLFYCMFDTIQGKNYDKNKITLKQLISVIFTLKNSLTSLKWFFSWLLSDRDFYSAWSAVNYPRAAIPPGFPRTVLDYTYYLSILIHSVLSHFQKDPSLAEKLYDHLS